MLELDQAVKERQGEAAQLRLAVYLAGGAQRIQDVRKGWEIEDRIEQQGGEQF